MYFSITKDEMDFWSFIFNGFTAVGTVGAVIISLWLSRPKKRFDIHKIEARAEHSLVGNRVERAQEGNLVLDIENCSEFQMQVFDARIHINGESVQVLPFNNCVISAMGRYHAKAVLPLSCVENGSFRTPKKVKVTVGTSFGNITKTVSNSDTLCRIMESEDEYTNIDTERRQQ